MKLLVVAGLAAVAFLLVRWLAKVTKLEVQIIYIILGIIVGLILSKTKYMTIGGLLPEINRYNGVALLLMFFSAGFSIDVGKLRRSGKTAGQLCSVPAYGELVVVTLVILALGGVLRGLGFDLGFAEAIMVAAIFATASPANVIPVCVNKIAGNDTGQNNLPSTMILATVIDGFITVPVVFAAAFVFMSGNMSKEFVGGNVGAVELIKIIVVILIGLVLAVVIGAIIGKFESVIFRKVFRHMQEKSHRKGSEYLLTTIVFTVGLVIVLLLAQVDKLKSMMTLFGVLVVLGIGFGINKWDKTGTSKIIGAIGNKIFYVFGMPAIFIYVGANIDLSILFDMKLLVILLGIMAIAVVVKGSITKWVLRDEKFSKADKRFAAGCFIPKGVGLSNFSVLFGAAFGSGEDVIRFMTMLAAVSIVVTMSVGIRLISKTVLGEKVV